jgi:hypothetical protein
VHSTVKLTRLTNSLDPKTQGLKLAKKINSPFVEVITREQTTRPTTATNRARKLGHKHTGM